MRILALDSMRGLFALAIVFLHGPFQGQIYYNSFVRNSDAFVDFFFVLSGFVVSLAYADALRDGRSVAAFFVRRIGRLWPLHAFVLGLFVLVAGAKATAAKLGLFAVAFPYNGAELCGFIAENVFLVHAFRNDTVFWLNFPSWSISAELWAYVAFGVLSLMPRMLPVTATIVIGCSGSTIVGIVEPGFGHFFGSGLHRSLCYFFVGYFVFVLWKRRPNTLPAATVLELALVVLVVCQVTAARNEAVRSLLPVTFAAAVLIFSFEAGAVSRLLQAAPFQALGRWSFSVYLIHAFIYELLGIGVRAVERLWRFDFHSPNRLNATGVELLDFGVASDLVMIGVAGLVVACASLTYRLVEVPGQRFARRLARTMDRSTLIAA